MGEVVSKLGSASKSKEVVMNDDLKDKLLQICSVKLKLSGEETEKVPYIPFVPQNWNGCLVLAEAQNHSKKNDEYLSWLKKLSSEGKMLRLYRRGKNLGCQPWDDGSLKFALACISDDEPERWAVCNAVLWSRRSSSDSNENPSEVMKENSIKLWTRYLDVLKPKWIVAAGKVAREVIENTGYKGKRLDLLLPSPRILQPVSNLFDTDDLLKRYRKVASKLEKYEMLLEESTRKIKILYACHAVSMAGKHKAGIYE